MVDTELRHTDTVGVDRIIKGDRISWKRAGEHRSFGQVRRVGAAFYSVVDENTGMREAVRRGQATREEPLL